jgi:hydroxyacylglutathione hydrolase
MGGDLNVTWIHGAPNHCASPTEPRIQVHRFDADTFILRQSKCSEPGTPDAPGPSFEAPFMYLLIGMSRAFLLDTGASCSPERFPLAKTVTELLGKHAAARGIPAVPLVIAHSHTHPDHIAGDCQFDDIAEATLVPPKLADVKSFFELRGWPNVTAQFALGDRTLDVIAIPGHEQSHIAIYDRNTELLLTGDTLYPGLLMVYDWPQYVRSVARLKQFVDARPVSFILGAHIEMTNQPERWFGLGALFQPGEHVLQLQTAHLTELNDALQAIGPHPRTDRHADFIIHPGNLPLPPDP